MTNDRPPRRPGPPTGRRPPFSRPPFAREPGSGPPRPFRPGPPPPRPDARAPKGPWRPEPPRAPAEGERPGPAPRRPAPRPPRRPPSLSGVSRPGEPAPSGDGHVLKATIEYDGGRYRGWQAQVNARTVQGVLLHAAHERLGPAVRVHGAGRTDAGVHALGQVASIHLGASRPPGPLDALRRDLNDLLPPDVNILSLVPAPRDFHARHAATLRVYRYRFARRRTAFGKPFVYWVKDRLDEAAMARAASALVGRHDFASFCENPEGHDSTIVEVSFAKVEVPAKEPDLVLFRIGASHFLWKMVRRIAGVLIEVGTSRMEPGVVAAFLAKRSAAPAPFTAPPSGLFLEAVLYPGDPALDVDPLRPAF